METVIYMAVSFMVGSMFGFLVAANNPDEASKNKVKAKGLLNWFRRLCAKIKSKTD